MIVRLLRGPSGREWPVLVLDGSTGQAALNFGGPASTDSVSCATVGNCAVGGSYTDATGNNGQAQTFVLNETNGAFRKAIQVPGLVTLNAGSNASIDSVSCGAAGNCAVVGTYRDGAGHTQAFVVSQA